MKELTDLEICKRIAEIEDEHITVVQCSDGEWLCAEYCEEYNPLTDDALCFKLMIKYEIEFWCLTLCDVAEYHAKTLTGNKVVSFESANNAICLAIIENNKE